MKGNGLNQRASLLSHNHSEVAQGILHNQSDRNRNVGKSAEVLKIYSLVSAQAPGYRGKVAVLTVSIMFGDGRSAGSGKGSGPALPVPTGKPSALSFGTREIVQWRVAGWDISLV